MTTIVFPIYDEVTQLDFTVPHQFLTMIPDLKVIVASVGGADINAQGLVFSNLADLEEIEECDVLCTPGGLGVVAAIENECYMNAVRKLAKKATYLTSVCSGSLVLAAAGVLKGHRAACHWAWRDMLADFGVEPDAGRIVRDGNIITGGGVTAGADFSLALLAELRGPETAQAVQLALEYAPAPPFNSGRPETAPAPLREAVQAQMNQLLGDGRRRIGLVAKQLNEATA